jgi:hypothetical protein
MAKINKIHKVPGYKKPNKAAIKAGAWKQYRAKTRSKAQRAHIAEYYRQERLGLEIRDRLAE